MSAETGHDLDAVDSGTGSALHHSVHPRRHRNLLASPFLRLPTELVLKIFVRAIEIESENNRLVPLVLTAICHKFREIGVTSSKLWGTVDLVTPPIAELFLERCNYDPQTLKRSPTASENKLECLVGDPGRTALWEKLKGCKFNGLRSIVFEGTKYELDVRVAGILRRAPNLSNLEIYNIQPGPELPSPISSSLPNLSTLRVRGFWVSWTSPLLRNLTQLVLDFSSPNLPLEPTSIGMFLTALAKCPNLEILILIHVGPDSLNGHQDNCNTVVQLCRLQDLRLEFSDPRMVGYILSHIEYPESTQLAVKVTAEIHDDLPEAISLVFPYRNVQTSQHFCKSKAITIHLGNNRFQFSTGNLRISFEESRRNFAHREHLGVLAQVASKIVEVVGGDTTASLRLEAIAIVPPDGMWEVLLRGLPRLEQICYGLIRMKGDKEFVDPFVFVFSRPCGGEPVCPWLQHLELSKVVVTQDTSAVLLERALVGRDVCDRRLKRLGLCGDATEDDWLVLEPFRRLVDKIR